MLVLNGQNIVKFWVAPTVLLLEHMFMSSIFIRISSYLLANSAIRIQIKNMEKDGFHARKMQKLFGWRHIKELFTRLAKNKILSHHLNSVYCLELCEPSLWKMENSRIWKQDFNSECQDFINIRRIYIWNKHTFLFFLWSILFHLYIKSIFEI